MIARKHFNSDLYETLHEYFYHIVMNFTIAWRFGISKLDLNLAWNLDQLHHRSKREFNSSVYREYIVYLYRSVITKHLSMSQPALCHRQEQYQEVMASVIDFVTANIESLVEVRTR